jgi:hypothetical protein
MVKSSYLGHVGRHEAQIQANFKIVGSSQIMELKAWLIFLARSLHKSTRAEVKDFIWNILGFSPEMSMYGQHSAHFVTLTSIKQDSDPLKSHNTDLMCTTTSNQEANLFLSGSSYNYMHFDQHDSSNHTTQTTNTDIHSTFFKLSSYETDE